MKHILAYLRHRKFLGMGLLVLGSFLVPLAVLLVIILDSAFLNGLFLFLLYVLVTTLCLFTSWHCYRLAYECIFAAKSGGDIAFGIFCAFGGMVCILIPIIPIVEYFYKVL